MRSVVIVRRPSEDGKQVSGLGRYSDQVEGFLSSKGVEPLRIESDVNTERGLMNGIIKGIIRPLLRTLRLRNSDIFHATDEWCCLNFPFIKGKKIVTVHHVLKKEEDSFLSYLSWVVSTGIAMRYADEIIAVSPLTRSDLSQRYGIPESKITVTLSTVGEEFGPLPDVKAENTVGCLGSLVPRKNTAAAIRAFKMLTEMNGTENFNMKIRGDGPEQEEIEELIEELGLTGRVEIIPKIPNEDIVKFYNSISVLMNPSLHEGLGLATIEAQRCMTPVVHFEDARIPPEVTKHSVGSRNDREFAENVHRLITDKEYREKTIRDGKEYADLFGKDSFDKLARVYDLDRDSTRTG